MKSINYNLELSFYTDSAILFTDRILKNDDYLTEYCAELLVKLEYYDTSHFNKIYGQFESGWTNSESKQGTLNNYLVELEQTKTLLKKINIDNLKNAKLLTDSEKLRLWNILTQSYVPELQDYWFLNQAFYFSNNFCVNYSKYLNEFMKIDYYENIFTNDELCKHLNIMDISFDIYFLDQGHIDSLLSKIDADEKEKNKLSQSDLNLIALFRISRGNENYRISVSFPELYY